MFVNVELCVLMWNVATFGRADAPMEVEPGATSD